MVVPFAGDLFDKTEILAGLVGLKEALQQNLIVVLNVFVCKVGGCLRINVGVEQLDVGVVVQHCLLEVRQTADDHSNCGVRLCCGSLDDRPQEEDAVVHVIVRIHACW